MSWHDKFVDKMEKAEEERSRAAAAAKSRALENAERREWLGSPVAVEIRSKLQAEMEELRELTLQRAARSTDPTVVEVAARYWQTVSVLEGLNPSAE